jgi:hypothetical protein
VFQTKIPLIYYVLIKNYFVPLVPIIPNVPKIKFSKQETLRGFFMILGMSNIIYPEAKIFSRDSTGAIP